MTLNTSLRITEPCDIESLTRFVHDRVLHHSDDAITEVVLDDLRIEDNHTVLSTKVGQGLCAWTWICTATKGPVKSVDPEDLAKYPEDFPDPTDTVRHGPDYYVDIAWDTAYGYMGNGLGCGDLHKILTAEVGAWCDEQGVNWWAQDESYGMWGERRPMPSISREEYDAAYGVHS